MKNNSEELLFADFFYILFAYNDFTLASYGQLPETFLTGSATYQINRKPS